MDHIAKPARIKVIRGDLMVIPIEDSVLYVEPIYLQSTQTQLPELKQVIVAFGNKLAMRETLEEGLKAVFLTGKEGIAASTLTTPPGAEAQEQVTDAKGAAASQGVPADARALVSQTLRLYRQGQAALAAGDWTAYGQAQAKLKVTLEDLAKSLNAAMRSGS